MTEIYKVIKKLKTIKCIEDRKVDIYKIIETLEELKSIKLWKREKRWNS